MPGDSSPQSPAEAVTVDDLAATGLTFEQIAASFASVDDLTEVQPDEP
jgi:hypothetical protein